MIPSAWMNSGGRRNELIGKFSTARAVCAPYSASSGTRISPIVSRSIRSMSHCGRNCYHETVTQRPLHGVVPALVTPFKDNERIDYGAWQTMIDLLISSGVHGLF